MHVQFSARASSWLHTEVGLTMKASRSSQAPARAPAASPQRGHIPCPYSWRSFPQPGPTRPSTSTPTAPTAPSAGGEPTGQVLVCDGNGEGFGTTTGS